MFGINGGELLILLALAAVLVGPERLPHYAEQLGRGVRQLRGYVGTTRARVVEETGLDWSDLDPRRYDPRRIVREALADEPARGGPPSRGRAGTPSGPGGPAPFDDEAT